MKYTDIKDLSRAELVKKRDGLRADMFQARMKNGLGQLSNPVQIRFLRRDLARVQTALGGNKEARPKTVAAAPKKAAAPARKAVVRTKKAAAKPAATTKKKA